MSKTEELLKAAFAGESQTNRRYLAFALKAEEEGQLQVARLFRAAAEAETVHAHNYLKAIRGVRGTRENLQEAILVESRAFKSVYPEMVENYSYYVCPVCGHTAEKTPPSTCPICGIKDPGYRKME